MPDTLVKDEVPVSSLNPLDTFYVSAYAGAGVYLDRQVSFEILTSSVATTLGNREIMETPAGTIDGINTDFLLSQTPMTNSLHVFRNGILQEISPTGDLTITNKTLMFNAESIPLPGDKLKAVYHF